MRARGVARMLLSFIEHQARAAGTNELSSDVSIAARPFLESIDPSGRGTLETRSPGSFRQLHPGWSVCRLERGRFLRQRYSAISCTFLSLCVMGPRPGSACSVSFTTGRLPERCQPKTSLRWGLSCLRPPGPVAGVGRPRGRPPANRECSSRTRTGWVTRSGRADSIGSLACPTSGSFRTDSDVPPGWRSRLRRQSRPPCRTGRRSRR